MSVAMPETGRFEFAALTRATEAWLVRELALEPAPLRPEMALQMGTWRDAPVTIETRAYRSAYIGYARFAVVRGNGLEIGNILCLPEPSMPVPILGADLVAVRRDLAMIAADLSPTFPSGLERDRQLAGIARRHASAPDVPSGGALPDWAVDRFSPYTLYTRISSDDIERASDVFEMYVEAFIESMTKTRPSPEIATRVRQAQNDYMTAHRVDDKGLGLLRKMFGTAWADRYLTDVLFPASAE